MVSVIRVVVSGWMEQSVVVSGAGQRRSVIEGILTGVIVRHRWTLTWAKWKEVKKVLSWLMII